MPARYVKPYVQRGKSDALDAEAICEAVSRPTMRFATIKTTEQQAVLTLHRAREILVKQQTMLANPIRGCLGGAFQSSRFIFATYHNAGVRVFDIDNPFQPREAGFFVPPDPERMFDPRPNRPKVIQSTDCFVDAQGVMYLTDNNAGLYVLQFEGA